MIMKAKVEENDAGPLRQAVIIRPPGEQEAQKTLRIGRDERSLEQIQQHYRENVPGAIRTETVFAGEPAILYTYLSPRMEIYAQHGGKVYAILTDETGKQEVRQVMGSFQFTD